MASGRVDPGRLQSTAGFTPAARRFTPQLTPLAPACYDIGPGHDPPESRMPRTSTALASRLDPPSLPSLPTRP